MINVVKFSEINKTKVFGLVIETISRNRLHTLGITFPLIWSVILFTVFVLLVVLLKMFENHYFRWRG